MNTYKTTGYILGNQYNASYDEIKTDVEGFRKTVYQLAFGNPWTLYDYDYDITYDPDDYVLYIDNSGDIRNVNNKLIATKII